MTRQVSGWWAILLLTLLLPAGPALAQPVGQVVRVATGEAPPFVMKRGDALAGFSIDLWAALAEKPRLTPQSVDLGRRSDDAQLGALRNGQADIAISAIAMTSAREA